MPEKKQLNAWSMKDLSKGNLDKILQHSDIYEAKLLKKVTEEKNYIPYSHVYQLQRNKSWQLVGYHCFGCDKVIKSKNITHLLIDSAECSAKVTSVTFSHIQNCSNNKVL